MLDDTSRENEGATAVVVEVARAERILAQAKEEVNRLEEALRLARGTGDVTESAAEAAKAVEPEPQTLAQRVEASLRKRIMTTDDLARALGEPLSRVFAAIKEVRPKVHNLGSPERARWSWRLGAEASPAELRALVERLISDTPMSFRDVVAATGAREGKVQGALVDIRRAHPGRVLDLGVPGKARWFMVPAGARDATLKRRR